MLLIAAYCIIAVILPIALCDSSLDFSGVYRPDLERSKAAEDFAASFLVSADRLIKFYAPIHGATNMAGVSFAVLRGYVRKKQFQTLMSRDYFDFLVEHLSPVSNYIPGEHHKIFSIYTRRMHKTAMALKQLALKQPQWNSDQRLNETLAILIYSSNAFTHQLMAGRTTTSQQWIRKYYIAATFWSVYRYIPNIAVFVASDIDNLTIRKFKLPAWKIVQLHVPLNSGNQTILLPRYSLEYSIKQLSPVTQLAADGNILVKSESSSKEGWDKFKYIYFSEGDQILHARHLDGLYDTIDNSDGSFAIVPHRMQVSP